MNLPFERERHMIDVPVTTALAHQIGSSFRNALAGIMSSSGSVALTALKGALTCSVCGLVAGFVLYEWYDVVGLIGSHAIGDAVLPYLCLAGAFGGATIGFYRGLRSGLKKALIGSEFVAGVYHDLIGGSLKQSDISLNGAGEVAARLSNLGELITRSDADGFGANTRRSRMSGLRRKIDRILSGAVGNTVLSISEDAQKLGLSIAGGGDIVNRLTEICQVRTDAILESSIDHAFLKPIGISYVTTVVLMLAPIPVLLW